MNLIEEAYLAGVKQAAAEKLAREPAQAAPVVNWEAFKQMAGGGAAPPERVSFQEGDVIQGSDIRTTPQVSQDILNRTGRFVQKQTGKSVGGGRTLL